MNSKISLLSLVLLIIFTNTIISQKNEEIIYIKSDDVIVGPTDEKSDILEKSITNKEQSKVNYKVNLGTSFSSSNFGNAVTMYTAPEIRYKLTPKLSISTGVLVTNSTVSDYYLAEKGKQTNFTNVYAFAGVNYQASEKLRISGEILYGMNKSPYSINSSKNSDYYLRFSAEYKITENLSIGLQVINQNMGYSGYRDPFYRDPFRTHYDPFNPFSRF